MAVSSLKSAVNYLLIIGEVPGRLLKQKLVMVCKIVFTVALVQPTCP